MTTIPRRFLAAVIGAVLFSSAALAQQVNTNKDNLAIDGYDPVAYFTEARPVPGVPEHQTQWQDATWRFSSAEHRALFESNPEKYAPRYGGFCSGAMSVKGYRAEINPEYWMIVDGNLFLGGQPMEFFQEDRSAKIDRADKNWSALN
jgi:YHS domain-containing protein